MNGLRKRCGVGKGGKIFGLRCLYAAVVLRGIGQWEAVRIDKVDERGKKWLSGWSGKMNF